QRDAPRVEPGGEHQPVERIIVARAALLRALSRFLRQARIPYSVAYMEDALAQNPRVAAAFVTLFETLFDPASALSEEARAAEASRLAEDIGTALDAVASLDVDRILRRFLNAIQATLRTNYFQKDETGARKDYVSFKFDSAALDDLPAPRPWREIFVYSAWVEGVHLRGGPVARGGLRWSDRREDFRTEVLGLVKAQQVKNAVIVPVGSKGGFLPKRLPQGGTREEVQAEAIRSYRTFLSGLLDITDNLKEGAPIPPEDVVRRDEDDPYLVVAADKGTASFSDIANEVAASYGFWLGDAFASGGSVGYDHKGMGITARGAWEAVKRHFRELGRDTQTEPFTVVGVGDMSGDVFGNGMLLSDQIKLIAAFDHRDIFIDPSPDPAASFAERQRLFALPRSSWKDYNESLISQGGGVFSRAVKAIPLSAEIKALTGLSADSVAPYQLINALLKTEADLLWFGGIGTYVKAAEESHADAGDRANDLIRVDAADVGARVIGEGANLGVTQLGRVALSARGVKLNTDAVDNAAGVDCSDHEVNIKIALGAAMASGGVSLQGRNALLAEMTDEVAMLVLASNYAQTGALSQAEAEAPARLEEHIRFMRAMEAAGALDRVVERLPSDEALNDRAKEERGLTRPELAVLLAYAKIGLYEDLLSSDLPDDPAVESWLIAYFPSALRDRFPDALRGHRLRREIIATVLANAVINEGGPTVLARLTEETGASAAEGARAFLAARALFGFAAIGEEIDALDNQTSAESQIAMRQAVARAHAVQSLRLLQRGETGPIGPVLERYGRGVNEVGHAAERLFSDFSRRRCESRKEALREAGAPEGLAARIATLEFLGGAVDIVAAAQALDRSVIDAASTYFAVGARFGLDWLRISARGIKPRNDWERLAIGRLITDLRDQQSSIAAAALKAGGFGACGGPCIAAWEEAHARPVAQADRVLAELRRDGSLSVAKLTVAAAQMRGCA
ncbi:MAG: NAD-glutamate dehydrogenase domain-containing protein, partial [Pseudomonadota bacterium]